MTALTKVVINRYKMSGADIEVGYFTNSSSAGGELEVGMSRVEMLFIQPLGASARTGISVVNESFPMSVTTGCTMSVVTDNDSESYGYVAIGSD